MPPRTFTILRKFSVCIYSSWENAHAAWTAQAETVDGRLLSRSAGQLTQLPRSCPPSHQPTFLLRNRNFYTLRHSVALDAGKSGPATRTIVRSPHAHVPMAWRAWLSAPSKSSAQREQATPRCCTQALVYFSNHSRINRRLTSVGIPTCARRARHLRGRGDPILRPHRADYLQRSRKQP